MKEGVWTYVGRAYYAGGDDRGAQGPGASATLP